MLVLASVSPRRRELMSMLTSSFDFDCADIDEADVKSDKPCELVEILAEKKAADVLSRRPCDVIIGADTVVALDGAVLGKPVDEADAKRMLRALSGKEHHVWTGVCVLSADIREVFSVCTAVRFLPLTDKQIESYVISGDPMDKAGAYGIQGGAALFVSGITGDYYNVMGLPVSRLNERLNELGIFKL